MFLIWELMMKVSKYHSFTEVGILALILALFFGCDPGTKSDRRNFAPLNVQMILNDGSPATNDTLLRISIRGNYISRLAVTTDPLLRGAEWRDYDSLIYLPVPAREGIVDVYGRFAADGGETTSVLTDDIEIDFSARINRFDVSAPSETLTTGELISFEVESGESGLAEVSFGSYFSDIRLTEGSKGLFSRTITIPGGIIDDSVFSIAKFRDAAGNSAEPVRSAAPLVLRGREIRPHLLGSLRIEGMAGVACLVRGSVSFVSDRNSKLHLIDVLDPSTPSYMRVIETSGWSGGMAATDRLLYLADGDAGLAIITIYHPNTAAIISRSHQVSGRVTDVIIDGAYVYVSTHISGLWVIDANDWISPRVIARLQIGGYGKAMVQQERTLFIAGQPSVACVDVADPRYPILLCEFAVDGDINDAITYEGRLYLATDTRGVVIYDVHDPSNPVFHSEHSELGGTKSIALMAPYMAVGRGSIVTVVNGAVPDRLPVIGDVGGLRGVAGIDFFENQLFIAGDGWFYTIALFD